MVYSTVPWPLLSLVLGLSLSTASCHRKPRYKLIKLACMLSNITDVKQATNSKHVIWVPFGQCDHCVVDSKI